MEIQNESNKLPQDDNINQQLFSMVNVTNMKVPLAYRPNTSDKWLLGKIFTEHEYNFKLHNFNPRFIIDGGANVGYSTTYFATRYPGAKIVALEPEPFNFKMLTYNTHFFDNVECINSALWNEVGYIKVLPDMPGNTLAFMTEATNADDPEALKTTTIAKVLADSEYEEIDLLKVDIEGAEVEVFGDKGNPDEWLPKVRVLTIELHDRMKVGCSYTFFKAISKYKYVMDVVGENLLFVRQDLVAQVDWNGNITLRDV